MQTLNFLLMAPPAGQNQNPFMSFLPIILIFIVFYFFMIRPQMKKAKDEKKFKEELKKGDKVVTLGGIHGKIIEVEEKTFIVEIDNGVRVKVEKTAISMDASRQLAAAK